MSYEITSAIINGVCVIAGVLLGHALSKQRSKQLSRKWSGDYMLPDPFTCASGDVHYSHDPSDCECVTFDFRGLNTNKQNEDFVSIVYQFSNNTSLVNTNYLSFEMEFKDGNCTCVDLEIKYDGGMTVIPCYYKRSNNDKHEFSIPLKEKVDKNGLKRVREICFVIKPKYHSGEDECFGTIAIRNLKLE